MAALSVDVSAAVEAANALTDLTATPKRPDDEKTHMVNIRLPESDYDRLSGLFRGHGVPLTTAIKMAAYHLADLVESGAVKINRGGIIDRRG